MEKITFEESGIKFTFPSNSAYKADSEEHQYNGLMAVDFVVETPERTYLIEVKNLENPSIPTEHLRRQKEEFLTKLGRVPEGDSKFQHSISYKLKDTLLKKLAMGEALLKPIVYILLLEFSAFDYQQRRVLLENIKTSLPTFSETEYSSIHSVVFDLCDKTKYESTYGPIFS